MGRPDAGLLRRHGRRKVVTRCVEKIDPLGHHPMVRHARSCLTRRSRRRARAKPLAWRTAAPVQMARLCRFFPAKGHVEHHKVTASNKRLDPSVNLAIAQAITTIAVARAPSPLRSALPPPRARPPSKVPGCAARGVGAPAPATPPPYHSRVRLGGSLFSYTLSQAAPRTLGSCTFPDGRELRTNRAFASEGVVVERIVRLGAAGVDALAGRASASGI